MALIWRRYTYELIYIYKRWLFLYYFCHWVIFSRLKNSKILERHLCELLCRVIGRACNYILLYLDEMHTRARAHSSGERRKLQRCAPTTGCEQLICVPNLFKETFHTAFAFVTLEHGNSSECKTYILWCFMLINGWYLAEHYLRPGNTYIAYCEMSDVCLHWLIITQE